MSHRSFLAICIVSVVAGCSHQVNKAPSSAATSVTPASFNTAGAPTVEFTVPDMMCPEGCGEKVKEILAEQPGTKDVHVDFPAKTVTVAIDKEQFDSKQALAALADHQFKNTSLKDGTAATASTSPPAADAKTVQ